MDFEKAFDSKHNLKHPLVGLSTKFCMFGGYQRSLRSPIHIEIMMMSRSYIEERFIKGDTANMEAEYLG